MRELWKNSMSVKALLGRDSKLHIHSYPWMSFHLSSSSLPTPLRNSNLPSKENRKKKGVICTVVRNVKICSRLTNIFRFLIQLHYSFHIFSIGERNLGKKFFIILLLKWRALNLERDVELFFKSLFLWFLQFFHSLKSSSTFAKVDISSEKSNKTNLVTLKGVY